MSDPFAGFLLKHKKGKGAGNSDSGDDSQQSDDSEQDDETSEKEADDAQTVDTENHKIAGAPATDDAIQHVKDVAESHQEDKNAEKGAEHLLRLIRTGSSRSKASGKVSASGKARAEPKLHPGMFHESRRGRSKAVSASDLSSIASSSAHIKSAKGSQSKSHQALAAHHVSRQSLAQRNALVVTSGLQGIPELHIRQAKDAEERTTGQISHTRRSAARVGDAGEQGDEAEAMRTLRNMRADAAQKTPGHFESVKGGTIQKAAAVPPQLPTESYFAYKWRISH